MLAHLMGQYCFAGWRLSSSSVTLPAGVSGGRRERGNVAGTPAAGRVGLGRPTLYGGPVVLRPVKATPCYRCVRLFLGCKTLIQHDEHFAEYWLIQF